MPRTRQPNTGVRASRAKKTDTQHRHQRPEHFIDDKRLLNEPPEIIPLSDMEDFYRRKANVVSLFTEYVEWLKTQRAKCLDIAGSNNGIRLPAIKNSAFLKLNAYYVPEVKEEPIDPEYMVEPGSANHNFLATNVNKNCEQNDKTENTPRRPLLRSSQIKPEVVTPVIDNANSLPTMVVKEESVAQKQHTVLSNRRQSPDKILKEEKNTPAIATTRKVGRPTRNKPPTAAAAQKTLVDDEKIDVFETKMKQAQQRKQQQEQLKVERAKKEREEKAKKVQQNLEIQKKEAERKAEERRKREEAEEEVRRMNAILKSPARSRIASKNNTPIRNKGASPARLVVPRTPALARVQLFANASPSPRTPGRKPAKLPRVDQLCDEANHKPAFLSPIRQVPRKVPNTGKSESTNILGVEVKQEKISLPSSSSRHGKVNEDFKNEQLRLLLGDQEVRSSADGRKYETERKEIEEEAKQLEEARRIQEELEKEEIRRKKEEARLKKEQARREQELLRQETAKREEEERIRRDIAKRQEEERRKEQMERERERAEELRRLKEEEENRKIEQEEKPVNKHLLNVTQEIDTATASDNSAYEMTQEKIWIPATAENYNIEDLSSGDETDDEGAPRKQVPSWAQWNTLYRTASQQYSVHDRDYDDMFGSMENPHNQPIFNQNKSKKRPRGSSAHWNSPASNPTKGKSRFLGY